MTDTLEVPEQLAAGQVTWPALPPEVGPTPASLRVYVAPTTPPGLWGRGYWGSSHWGGYAWDHPVELECSTQGLAIARGRSNPLDHFRAGRLEVTLSDPTGELTPWVIPWDGVRRVRTGCPIRVQCSAGVLFTGYVTRLEGLENTDPAPARVVQLEATDPLAYLAGTDGDAQADQGAGELAPARLTRILNNARLPAWVGRRLDPGVRTMQATTLAGDALTEAWLTADSDAGQLWADPDGTICFADPNVGMADPRRTSPQVMFTDDDALVTPYPLVCCRAFTVTDDAAAVINRVSIAAKGSTAMVRSDTDSIAFYGVSGTQRHDLIHQGGTAGSDQIAATLLTRATRQSVVVSPLVFDALRDPTSWAAAHQLELGDRVAVHRARDGHRLDISATVDQINHQITPTSWQTTITLSPGTQRTDYSRWGRAHWGIDNWS